MAVGYIILQLLGAINIIVGLISLIVGVYYYTQAPTAAAKTMRVENQEIILEAKKVKPTWTIVSMALGAAGLVGGIWGCGMLGLMHYYPHHIPERLEHFMESYGLI